MSNQSSGGSRGEQASFRLDGCDLGDLHVVALGRRGGIVVMGVDIDVGREVEW